MKRYDKTSEMIGQLIGPLVEPLTESLTEPLPEDSKVPTAESAPNSQPYRLMSLLGKQPGRRSFLAVDERTQEQVVIKLLLFGPDFTWEDLKLFEREAETLKSLDHPAIPEYLDSFETETLLGSGFVLVQTYIEANSLQGWISGGRRFDETDLKAIARSLLAILKYLHSRHPTVVHRDIKPSNILLADRSGHSPGELYLIDFGSVQITNHSGTMTVVGTYGYMPPEQFGGRAFPASDLYSLGATLVYMATGQHPAELMQNDLQLEFREHTTLSAPFAQWIGQLTNPNLSKRIQSTEQALKTLTQPQETSQLPAVAHSPGTVQPVTTHPRETNQQPSNTHGQLRAHSDGTLSTRRDLKVSSTPREFALYFSPTRLGPTPLGEFLSSGIVTGLALFVALAIYWPLCLLLLLALAVATARKPKQSFAETAVLKLRANRNDTLSLRLIADAKQTVEPVSWCNLEKIDLEIPFATSQFSNRLMFTFEKHPSRNFRKLRIDGNRSEIRWLRDQISGWNNVSIHS